MEPLWSWIIRTGRLPRMVPMLERVLAGGRSAGRRRGVESAAAAATEHFVNNLWEGASK